LNWKPQFGACSSVTPVSSLDVDMMELAAAVITADGDDWRVASLQDAQMLAVWLASAYAGQLFARNIWPQVDLLWLTTDH